MDSLLKFINMRSNKYILVFILAAVFATVLFSACSKKGETPDYNANKSALSHLIDSLTQVYNAAVEGNKPGNYATGAKAQLDTAIILATTVNTGNTFTQEQVNNTYNNLLLAARQFNTKLIGEVSSEYLVAHWKFDGDATDATGNGHNGVLKTGWVGSSVATIADGGTLPQLGPDRFGRPNMAYTFNNGSLIQVPYSPSLNPGSLTISMWVKMTANTNGSYMISMRRWLGYKFNLNGTGVPFFTVSVSPTTIYDRDAGAVNVSSIWTHLAVSYTAGTEKFYVNGDLVKTWTDVPGGALTLTSPVDLSIGNEMPKEFYNLTNSLDANYFYGASYFIGSMDDIRFYNTVLSDSDISTIYSIEQTP
jgi:hypothetical protein